MNENTKRTDANENAGRRAAAKTWDVGADESAGFSEYTRKRHRRTLLRLVAYFGVSKPKTALALSFSMAYNFALIAQPLVVRTLIDSYLSPGIFDYRAITLYALAYFAVALAGNVSRYAQQLTLVSLGQQILHKMRTGLFSHIQTLNMRFFDRNTSGRILTRLTSDIEELQELFTSVFIMAVREGILIIGMVVTMFALDPGLAAWCLLSAPIVAALTVTYRFISRKNFIEIKALLSRINGYLAEHIVGMRVIQMFNREQRKYDDFAAMNQRYYKLGLRRLMLNSLSSPLIMLLSNLMIALFIYSFGSRVGLGLLNIGVLYAFTAYIRQLFEPIAQLAEQFTSAQSALISADRIFDILDNAEDAEDLNAGRRIYGGLRGEIEFERVWFAYNEGEWVLRDVSFHISPGESAAFVGATGGGKTTIMNLLLRYYIPQRGRILLDGVELGAYSLNSLRRAVAIVMQDVFLFSGDIEYNIRLGNELTREQVVEAAEAANCDALIRALPDGYAHAVAERGSDFSLGQRQLISFARALAVKPSVLILDEATASVDTETELALQEGLAAYAAGRTLVVIAHRISTIVNSDIIFVLDRGRIAERGKHAELLEIEGGLYKKLYMLSVKSATG